MPHPKVSICVVVYNHELYLEKCLQSLVDQVTDFDFEIIVGEDCSKDESRAIVESFAARYPDKIVPLLHSSNLGGTRNLFATHRAAKGKYVAQVDGDDFVLPGKIQKQKNFLDSHPECIAVVHRLANVSSDGHPLNTFWPQRFSQKDYDLARLVLNHPEFGHSSLMYRNGAYSEILDMGVKREVVDFFLYVHLASQGRIGIIHETLGGYRTGVGVSTHLNLIDQVKDSLDYARERGLDEGTFRKASARQCCDFAVRAYREGRLALFKTLITQSINYRVISARQLIVFTFAKVPPAMNLILRAHSIYKSIRTCQSTKAKIKA